MPRSSLLDLDYILIHSPDTELPDANPGFLKDYGSSCRGSLPPLWRIMALSAKHLRENSLDVWISTGRDQMNIIKRLIDNSFSAQQGIHANVSLVTVDIRSAVLAGTAPGMCLCSYPVIWQLIWPRGAVEEDLSKYDGFDQVAAGSRRNHDAFFLSGGLCAAPLRRPSI